MHLKLVDGSRTTLLRFGPPRVNPTPALTGDLEALLGPGSLAS